MIQTTKKGLRSCLCIFWFLVLLFQGSCLFLLKWEGRNQFWSWICTNSINYEPLYWQILSTKLTVMLLHPTPHSYISAHKHHSWSRFGGKKNGIKSRVFIQNICSSSQTTSTLLRHILAAWFHHCNKISHAVIIVLVLHQETKPQYADETEYGLIMDKWSQRCCGFPKDLTWRL